MKKFLLGLVTATMFLSCSSDDSSGSSGNIYGVWELQKRGVMVGDNPVLEDVTFMTPCTEYDRMIYSENGIWTQFYYYGYGGTCTKYEDDGTFTYENGIITYIEVNENPDYEEDGKCHIIELTNTTMMYKYYDPYYLQYNENPWRVFYYVRAN